MSILSPRKIQPAAGLAHGMSKAAIEGIFKEVESDPLAGMGDLTKREIVIDKLIAHWNVLFGKTPPAPVINEDLDIPSDRGTAGK